MTTDWGGEFDAAGLSGDHGGKWETSLMMARDKNTVDLKQIEKIPKYRGLAAGANAVEATLKQGRKWINACAEAIAGEAKWLVDNYPELPQKHHHRR